MTITPSAPGVEFHRALEARALHLRLDLIRDFLDAHRILLCFHAVTAASRPAAHAKIAGKRADLKPGLALQG